MPCNTEIVKLTALAAALTLAAALLITRAVRFAAEYAADVLGSLETER